MWRLAGSTISVAHGAEAAPARAKQTPRIRLCRAAGVAPLGGLSPDIEGPVGLRRLAKSRASWLGAACKVAEGATGGIHTKRRPW